MHFFNAIFIYFANLFHTNVEFRLIIIIIYVAFNTLNTYTKNYIKIAACKLFFACSITLKSYFFCIHFPVVPRCHSRIFFEYFCEIIIITKSTFISNFVNLFIGFNKKLLSLIHPDFSYIFGNTHAVRALRNTVKFYPANP